MQTTARSAYDNIVWETRMEERAIIAEKFIRKYPDWPDQAISDLLEVEIEHIQQIRQDLKKRKLIPQ